MIKRLRFIVYTAALALCSIGQAMAELPLITEARIVQPPPGAKVAAAYFNISNVNDDALVITRASSTLIPQVGIHLSKTENDIAKMLEQESVTIDAGETLEFKHGSFHLMLMGLEDNLNPGSMIDITLETNSGNVTVHIPVVTPDEASSLMSHDSHGSSKKMKKHDQSHDNEHGKAHEAKETESMNHNSMSQPEADKTTQTTSTDND